jgi:hypothetical protein
MIRVSKFYKDSKDGKFISSLDKDTRTLYDTFRKGAKESSKWLIQDSSVLHTEIEVIFTIIFPHVVLLTAGFILSFHTTFIGHN